MSGGAGAPLEPGATPSVQPPEARQVPGAGPGAAGPFGLTEARTEGGGFVIEGIWAWIMIDPDDGDEGVIGVHTDEWGWLPLIGADRVRLDEMRPYAEMHAHASGQPVKLVRFSTRDVVEVFEP